MLVPLEARRLIVCKEYSKYGDACDLLFLRLLLLMAFLMVFHDIDMYHIKI